MGFWRRFGILCNIGSLRDKRILLSGVCRSDSNEERKVTLATYGIMAWDSGGGLSDSQEQAGW